MSLAVRRQKAIVCVKSRQKVTRTDSNREFCITLETVSATGQVIPLFIVWANKVHCTGITVLGIISGQQPSSRSASRYMDDDLCLDYIMKHFDSYNPPKCCTLANTHSGSSYIVAILHTLWLNMVLAIPLYVLYCDLPPHSTHLM